MKRVLLVDGDSPFARRLAGLLGQTDEALAVSVQDSIAGATKSLRAEPFDLIVSHLCLPLIEGQPPSLEDGVQFALLVKRRYPDLPLCLLGDLQAPELHSHHRRLFGAECYQRPQQPEALEALALTIRRRLFGYVLSS
jgi:DNA-binding NtrC family response regulator